MGRTGGRHPQLLQLTGSLRPALVGEDVWGAGTIPLRVSVYDRPARLPEELITSVRCLVRVGERVVICRNADGVVHALPGGRREPGETVEATAVREVAEETGWRLDIGSIRPAGWLHLQHLGPWPTGGSGRPYPDFVMPVLRARAGERLAGAGEEWTDTDNYEIASWLATVAEAITLVAGERRERWALPLLHQRREEATA